MDDEDQAQRKRRKTAERNKRYRERMSEEKKKALGKKAYERKKKAKQRAEKLAKKSKTKRDELARKQEEQRKKAREYTAKCRRKKQEENQAKILAELEAEINAEQGCETSFVSFVDNPAADAEDMEQNETPVTTASTGSALKQVRRDLTPRTRKKIDSVAAKTLKSARKLGFRDRDRMRTVESQNLRNKVESFAKDNSVPNPDKKRGTKGIDPITGKDILVRYRVSTLKVLHSKFESEVGNMSFSHFCRLFPKTVILPKATEWGTCLCVQCVNLFGPEVPVRGPEQFSLFHCVWEALGV